MENGTLLELERSIMERKSVLAQASADVDKLVAGMAVARCELERRDAAAVSSLDELQLLRVKTLEV